MTDRVPRRLILKYLAGMLGSSPLLIPPHAPLQLDPDNIPIDPGGEVVWNPNAYGGVNMAFLGSDELPLLTLDVDNNHTTLHRFAVAVGDEIYEAAFIRSASPPTTPYIAVSGSGEYTGERLYLVLDYEPETEPPGTDLHTYISSTLAPLVYYRFNEVSGVLVDYGSEGADGAVSGATQGQTGQMGTGEAYLFDGVDDIVTVDNGDIPNVKALTTQRWAALVYSDSMGEGSDGVVWTWGDKTTGSDGHVLRHSSLSRMNAMIRCQTTKAASESVNNAIADLIDHWAWWFMDFDNANSLGFGRVIRLWKGINGTLTKLSLGTETAAVGDPRVETDDFNIGNQTNLLRTYDGLIDVLLGDSGLWSDVEMQQLIDLSGV